MKKEKSLLCVPLDFSFLLASDVTDSFLVISNVLGIETFLIAQKHWNGLLKV